MSLIKYMKHWIVSIVILGVRNLTTLCKLLYCMMTEAAKSACSENKIVLSFLNYRRFVSR